MKILPMPFVEIFNSATSKFCLTWKTPRQDIFFISLSFLLSKKYFKPHFCPRETVKLASQSINSWTSFGVHGWGWGYHHVTLPNQMQISTCLVFYEKKKKSCHVLAPVLHVSYLVSFPEMGKTTKGCNLNTSMWWHPVREQINVMATFSKKRAGALTFVAPISSHKGMGKVPKSNLGNVGRHKLVLNSVTIPALHAITI